MQIKKQRKKNSNTEIKKAEKKINKKTISGRKLEIKKSKTINKVPFSSDEEISKKVLEKISNLERIHEERKKLHTLSDTIAYWSFLFLILITNFIVSLVLIILIIFLQTKLLYIIAIILGIGFGFIYEQLINGMTHIFVYHHIFAKLFFAFTSSINIIYILWITRSVSIYLDIDYNIPFILGISLAYYVSYIMPYFIMKLVRKNKA